MPNPEKAGLIDRMKSIEERLLMVVNPMSKKGSELSANVRRLVRREGMVLEETSTDHPDDIGATLEFWSRRFGGSRVIMVFGGDGAINQVINNIMLSRSNKNSVLVPVPAGTANDFCRALGIESPEGALEAMVDFNFRTVDLIKMEFDRTENGCKYCSNIVGIGLDGDLARRSIKYKRFGVPGYWYASLKHAAVMMFRKLPKYRMRVRAEGIERESQYLGVMFANINRYGRNLLIAPGAEPDDGKIHVTLVRSMSTLKALISALLLLKGWHTRISQVDTFTCRELEVDILDDVYAQEDGEVRFYPRGTRIKLSLEEKVIDVLTVPRAQAAKRA